MPVSLTERVDLLQRTVLMRNLRDPKALETVAAGMREVEIPEGAVVAAEGEPADALYVVVSGEVRASVGGATLSLMEPGSYFGEMGLFAGGRRTATVTATRPTRCLVLDYAALSTLLEQTPRLGTNLLKGLCGRIRKLNGLVVATRCPVDDAEEAPIRVDTPDRDDLIRTIPLFRGVTDERCLAKLAAAMQEATFAPGEPIVAAGERGDRLYVVLAGHVKAHVEELELARLGPGSCLGEMALLDGEPQAASATAVEPTTCLVLTQGQLFAAMSQAPSIQRNLIAALCARMVALSASLAAFDGAEHADGGTDFAPYLDLPAEPLFVKDEATESWGVPATGAIAREFVATVAESKPAEEVDGFARALDLDRAAFLEALTAEPVARAGWPDEAAGLAEALYARLRTPIQPKRGHVELGQLLRRARLHPYGEVRLGAVLASPTAARELPYFLDTAELFRRQGFRTRLKLLMVRWENQVEMAPFDAATRQAIWESQVRAVEAILQERRLPGVELTTASLEVDPATGTMSGPTAFVESCEQVAAAARDLHAAPADLARDLLWITGFYARQESLSRLGEQQPLTDLAIRRAIGRVYGDLFAIGPRDVPLASAMVTSELNRRFVGCYASRVPVVNIAVH